MASSVSINNSIIFDSIPIIISAARRIHFYAWAYLNIIIAADKSIEEPLSKEVKPQPQESQRQLVLRKFLLGMDFFSGSE